MHGHLPMLLADHTGRTPKNHTRIAEHLTTVVIFRIMNVVATTKLLANHKDLRQQRKTSTRQQIQEVHTTAHRPVDAGLIEVQFIILL